MDILIWKLTATHNLQDMVLSTCMSKDTTLPKSYILFINMHTKSSMDTNLKINNPEFHPFSTIFSQ